MAKGHAQPTLGFPTKTAAIEALLGQGLEPRAVAERIGCTPQTVFTAQSKLRRRLKAMAESDLPLPGIWTPEKHAKARRLFGKSMMLIADALQVPPKELLQLVLNGVLPPMGKGQRLGQLISDMAEDEAPLTPPSEESAPRSVPPVASAPAGPTASGTPQGLLAGPAALDPASPAGATEPSRDDDEAELAALEQEQHDEADAVNSRDDGHGDDGDAEVFRAFYGPDAGAAAPAFNAAAIAVRRTVAAAEDEAEEVEAAAPEPEPEASGKGLTHAPQRSASLADEIVARHHGPRTVPAPKSVAGRVDPMAMPMAAALRERFKLRDEAGAYLHEHERGMTRVSKFMWRGTADQVKSLKRRKPHLRALIEEVAIG